MYKKSIFKTSIFCFSNKLKIETALSKLLNPTTVIVKDESKLHKNGFDSHFRVFIVSELFKKLSLVERHKIIYQVLKNEQILDHLTALGITAKTISENEAYNTEVVSPPCERFK